MVKKSLRVFLIGFIGVIIVFLIWGAFSISNKLEPIRDIIEGVSESAQKETESGEIIDTVRGTAYRQSGSSEDKAIQCVADFFQQALPDLGYDGKDCEVKKFDESLYCVYIGDWFVFVGCEYNVFYTKEYYKTKEFTDYEKKAILKLEPNAKFIYNEGTYKLEV